MTLRWLGLCASAAAGLLLALKVEAQGVEATAYGLAATNAEVDRTRQARGLGIGADLGLDFGRYRLNLRALTASLDADFKIQPDYAVHELSLLATYQWRSGLAFQLGAGRRFTSPDFVAQEVGVVRVGLLTETTLSSIGRIWGRAAYLPVTRFSGGGGSDLALELGLGVSLGPSDGRFNGIAEYAYQRIDREVNGGSVPIRFSEMRAGLRWRRGGR
jgi:hypothetical protein